MSLPFSDSWARRPLPNWKEATLDDDARATEARRDDYEDTLQAQHFCGPDTTGGGTNDQETDAPERTMIPLPK